MDPVLSLLLGDSGGGSNVGGQSGGLSGGLVIKAELSSFGERGETAVGTFSSANRLAGETGLAEALSMLVDLGRSPVGGLSGPPSGGVRESGSSGGESARPDGTGIGI